MTDIGTAVTIAVEDDVLDDRGGREEVIVDEAGGDGAGEGEDIIAIDKLEADFFIPPPPLFPPPEFSEDDTELIGDRLGAINPAPPPPPPPRYTEFVTPEDSDIDAAKADGEGGTDAARRDEL